MGFYVNSANYFLKLRKPKNFSVARLDTLPRPAQYIHQVANKYFCRRKSFQLCQPQPPYHEYISNRRDILIFSYELTDEQWEKTF